MNNIIVTIKRSIFPLTKFYLTVGDESYSISSGELKKIKLSNEEVYEITANSFWIRKKESLYLNDQSVLCVKHIIPDMYYFIGGSIIFILSALTFFGMFNAVLFAGIVLIYLAPLMYFTFLRPKNYFKIEVKTVNLI